MPHFKPWSRGMAGARWPTDTLPAGEPVDKRPRGVTMEALRVPPYYLRKAIGQRVAEGIGRRPAWEKRTASLRDGVRLAGPA